MRRADGNDNDFSGALTDRRQRAQLGSALLAAVVHALVNLLDRLAHQYTVNCPAEFAMIEDFDTLVAKWRGYARYGLTYVNWRFINGSQVS